MKVLIIGATGATGHWLVQGALAQGHQVTAFVRKPESWQAPAGVRVAKGDARDKDAMDAALKGQDAVLSAFGPRSLKKDDIQETLMRNLVDGMKKNGVKRLVSLSALGMGDSANEGPLFYRAVIMPLFLKNVFADKARGEDILFASGLDYVSVRPGMLMNSKARGGVKAGLKRDGMVASMTRADLAAFMLEQLTSDTWLRQSPIIGY